MKLIHIITGLPYGGAQTSLYNLLANSKNPISNNIVISLMDVGVMGESIQRLGVPVHAVRMQPGLPSPVAITRLLHIAKTVDPPDIVMGWEYHGILSASFLKFWLFRSLPLIWNIRHTPYRIQDEKRITSLIIRMEAKYSNQPSNIIYNSFTSRDRHQDLGFSPDNGMVIPNGFDTSTYHPSPEHYISVRKELNLNPKTILIGLIARYHPMKDHACFLKSASILARKYSNIHFLLVGEGIDHNNQDLVTIIRNLNIENLVHLLGERTDMSRLSAALDIATNSSAWGEGFSNAIGEAMACGVPCVVTDIGDSARIVGNTGLVVKPRDTSSLAEAWSKILSLPADQQQHLGFLARHRIIENYSLQKMISAYEELYTNIVDLSKMERGVISTTS